MRMPIYDKQGREIDCIEWSKKLRDPNYLRVKQEFVWWGAWVSTVWIGLDHSWCTGGEKQIFETMIFSPFRHRSMYVTRYPSLERAETGHKQIVQLASHPLYLVGLICGFFHRCNPCKCNHTLVKLKTESTKT